VNAKHKVAQLLRERLAERYIDPVNALSADEKNEFAIMALSCLLIETLESFRQGWARSPDPGYAFCSVCFSIGNIDSMHSQDMHKHFIEMYAAEYSTKARPLVAGVSLVRPERPFSAPAVSRSMRLSSTGPSMCH